MNPNGTGMNRIEAKMVRVGIGMKARKGNENENDSGMTLDVPANLIFFFPVFVIPVHSPLFGYIPAYIGISEDYFKRSIVTYYSPGH